MTKVLNFLKQQFSKIYDIHLIQNTSKSKIWLCKKLAVYYLLFLYKEQTYLSGSITAGYFEISFICSGKPNSEEGISIWPQLFNLGLLAFISYT